MKTQRLRHPRKCWLRLRQLRSEILSIGQRELCFHKGGWRSPAPHEAGLPLHHPQKRLRLSELDARLFVIDRLLRDVRFGDAKRTSPQAVLGKFDSPGNLTLFPLLPKS